MPTCCSLEGKHDLSEKGIIGCIIISCPSASGRARKADLQQQQQQWFKLFAPSELTPNAAHFYTSPSPLLLLRHLHLQTHMWDSEGLHWSVGTRM